MNQNEVDKLFAKKLIQSFEDITMFGDKPKPVTEPPLFFTSETFEPIAFNYFRLQLDMAETLSQHDYLIVTSTASMLAEYRRIKRTLHCSFERERKGMWRFNYAGHVHTFTHWRFHEGKHAIYGRVVKLQYNLHLNLNLGGVK
jgi:hypothetical protein